MVSPFHFPLMNLLSLLLKSIFGKNDFLEPRFNNQCYHLFSKYHHLNHTVSRVGTGRGRGKVCLLEWIPKWQNKIDAWFSGRLLSKMVRKSWIFHKSHNRKLCMGQKWQKLQIQDLLNEVYPKGQIFKMTLFSPIDLDKIMPKNPK